MRLRTFAATLLGTGIFGVVTPAHADSLYLIAPCAPADVLGFGLSGFQGSSPVFVDGKPKGQLAVCDAKSFSLAPGKHNVRVKLAGKSDYGISSDAGMEVTIGSRPVYVVMTDANFYSAMVVDEARGRDLLSDVRTARKK